MAEVGTVPRWQKIALKKQAPCLDAIKMYKIGMGVDLIDQRFAAYNLDRKLTIRFYLSIFLTWQINPMLTVILFATSCI